jgi:CheY-like chemotaxis protein
MKQTVLVVDDEPKLVGLLRTILEKEGYSVIEAHNGYQAL